MKRTRDQKGCKWLVAILLAVSPLTVAAENEPPVRYMIHALILMSDQMLLPKEENTTVVSIGNDDALNKLMLGWKNDGIAEVLSRPFVPVAADQEAVIRMQSEVQYFEHAKDESLVLRSLPDDEAAGLLFHATISKVEEQGMVSVDMRLQLRTLRDRKKIPGVSFDIGHPVMQTQSIKTKVRIPIAQWMRIDPLQMEDAETGEKEYIMMLFQVAPIAAQ